MAQNLNEPHWLTFPKEEEEVPGRWVSVRKLTHLIRRLKSEPTKLQSREMIKVNDSEEGLTIHRKENE